MAPRPSFPSRRLPALAAGLSLAALASSALATPATAQELRLRDGRVLVGEYRLHEGHFEVETRDGLVVVPESAVFSTIAYQRSRYKLAQLSKMSCDTASAHLHPARQALDYGLEREMWRHLDRALALLGDVDGRGDPDPIARRLRDFLAQLEPELLPSSVRQAPTRKRVQAMLKLFRADTGDGVAAALEELLVREPNADQELRREARRNPNRRQRIAALAALQRRPTAGNARFVLRTAVLDKDSRLREAAFAIGRPTIDTDDVVYMAGALAHENGKVRVRTAEALGGLGHPAAVDLLVKAGPHAAAGLANGGQGAPRAHVAFLQQQAYIRDYDVEVAQAAFIADPRIDVLQSGTVLDVTVAGVYEVRTIVRAYRAALKQLTAADPGPDPRDWPAWREKLPEPATPVETERR